MVYRIAAVSYLNAWPLVAGLSGGHVQPPAGRKIELQHEVPSVLAELLFAGEADVALVPIVEHFRGMGAGLVPGIGIACQGPVESVKLFTRVTPAAIGRVQVDKGSRTSVALLRILLAEMFDVRPDFYVAEPKVDELLRNEEAALVIGDRCFEAEARFRREGVLAPVAAAAPSTGAVVAAHDLGELWHRLTGLPFVFAAWMLGRGFVQDAGAEQTTALADLLTAARDWGLAHLDELAERAAAEGRPGPSGDGTAASIRRYFAENIRYTLGERELAGAQRFHELCVRHCICPAGRSLALAAAAEQA